MALCGGPLAALIGRQGQVFGLLGRAVRELRARGQPESVEAVVQQVLAAGSYAEAVAILRGYFPEDPEWLQGP